MAFAASAAAVATVPPPAWEEFVPSVGTGPNLITRGPDGAMWFSEYSANRIGRVDDHGAVIEFPTSGPSLSAGAHPSGVAAGSDGNLWFTENGTGMIGAIDPDTGQLVGEFPIPSGAASQPEGIVSGPDGALWFTEPGGGRIGRIDPSTHAITEYPLTNFVGRVSYQPVDLTSGPGGLLWVTVIGTGQVARVDTSAVSPGTSSGITLYDLPTPASQPEGLTIGPDGNVWIAEYTGRVARLNPSAVSPGTSDGITEFPTGGHPLWIASGHDGGLWVTDNLDHVMIRFDPGTQATTVLSTTQGVGGDASGDTADAEGNVWYTEFHSNRVGEVTLVTPRNVALPSVLGSATPGQTVTCSSGDWADTGESPVTANDNFTVQWLLDGQPLGPQDQLGTGDPLPLGQSYAGHQLACQITVTNAVGATSATSVSVLVGGGGAPVNTGRPQITGPPLVGQTVTCQPGTWTDQSGTPGFTYEWFLDTAVISAQTQPTLALTGAMTGRQLTCRVSAHGHGTGQATSNPVTVSNLPPLRSTSPPVIYHGSQPSDFVHAGDILTCHPAKWTNPIRSHQYHWYWYETVSGTKGHPARGVSTQLDTVATPRLVLPDLPASISNAVRAGASRIACVDVASDGPSIAIAQSDQVRIHPVKPALSRKRVTRGHVQLSAVVERPSITPGVGIDGTNFCNPGKWDHFPHFDYAWYINGGTSRHGVTRQKRIGRKQSITITASDKLHRIFCEVTATNGAGSTLASSNSYVVPQPPPPTHTGDARVRVDYPPVDINGLPVVTPFPVTSPSHPLQAGGDNEFRFTCAPPKFTPANAKVTFTFSVTYPPQSLPGDSGEYPGNTLVVPGRGSRGDELTLLTSTSSQQATVNGKPEEGAVIVTGSLTCTATAKVPNAPRADDVMSSTLYFHGAP